MDPLLIRHIEAYLGRIERGWKMDADLHGMPFQAVRLSGENLPKAKYFSTLGLSNFPLKSRTSDKTILCELVMATHDDGGMSPSLLHQVGQEVVESGHAPLRGDVIGPRGSLIEGATTEALYASIPVYFPDEFASCMIKGTGTVIFIWLIPITDKEADFVNRSGWDAFEDLLEKEDPDLLDLFRSSIVP